MIRPRISRPADGTGNDGCAPTVLGYDIVAVTPTQTLTVIDEHGIPASSPKHLEIAAGLCAYPLLIGAVEEAISQIEHMARQLGVPDGTGTSNATLDTLQKALEASQSPRFNFHNEADEEVMRQFLARDESPAFRR